MAEEVEVSNENNKKLDFVLNEDGTITVDDITIPAAPLPALTIESDKERLIITELVVTNFKSYAGTHILGPFNKNFSCIVGPNGSGKSNVIDALLFVFGYKAQKIRSKKVSVLIHKSDKYQNVDSCSVTVRFATIKDEGAKYTILPDSLFSVSRTAFQDNSSVYEINNHRSTYKGVAALLKNYGIDLEYNRFMILQGEIELISMMKPKSPNEQETGMLEYIEDVIGSNRLIEPIKHFFDKSEEINELRLEKNTQLKIVEKERADAEKPRNKAMEYLRLANKITVLENSVLQAQIKDISEEDTRLEEEKKFLSTKIAEHTTSIASLEKDKQLKDMELKCVVEEHEAGSKTVEDLKKQFTHLERTDVACKENIKNNKEKIKKLKKSLESEEQKIINLKNQPNVFKREIEELEQRKEKLQKTKKSEEEKLVEAMGSMKDEIKDYQEQKDSFEEDLVPLKQIVNEKKSEMDLVQCELDLILSSEKKEKEVLEKLSAEYEKTLSSSKEEKENIANGKKTQPELNSKLLSSKQKLESIEQKEKDLTEQLKIKRNKLDDTKITLSASQSRNTLVKAFMEQKKQGKLQGVYGRLGDLGSIDEKFDVAISTACGALDNIVTDTMATAQECVQFLKANDLGYATFIALDQMKKWEPYTTRKVSTPENVHRLFDLVKVNDKSLLTAFYFGLAETLVANDLDQATRVGLQGSKRHRVVTLKGELIDMSGTMSGGGGKVLKGRMGQTIVTDSSASEQEIKSLSSDIDTLMKDLEEMKRTKMELRISIEQGDKELAALQHSLKKSELSYKGYQETLKTLEKRIADQKEKVKLSAPDKAKTQKLEAQITELNKIYKIACDDATTVEDKVKSLQEKILSITKGKYGSVQKKIETLDLDIKKTSQNITKTMSSLKSSAKNLEKAENKITSLKDELEGCEKSMETLKTEFKDIENKALEVSDQKKQAEELLIAIQLKKSILTGEVKEFSTKVHAIKSEITELKNKSKMLDIEARGIHGKLRSLKEKLSKLELHEVEEEDQRTLPILSEEEIAETAVDQLSVEIGNLKSKIKDMNPDLRAIAEFKRKEEMYRHKLKDLEETTAKRDHFRRQCENLKAQRKHEFSKGFNIITLKVKELYQMMTLGGDAELELVDSVDPFSEGIEFSVRPFRKSWKNIRNLSGGEKTLSSLSLVFALHFYRTTPFFVMDEIDAALDFRNVSIIGSYIKGCTKNAQFIVISLRENMFSLADHMIGIYKTNNCTKNIYISPPPCTVEEDTNQEVEKPHEITRDSVFDTDSLMENLKEISGLSSIPQASLDSNIVATSVETSSARSPLKRKAITSEEVPPGDEPRFLKPASPKPKFVAQSSSARKPRTATKKVTLDELSKITPVKTHSKRTVATASKSTRKVTINEDQNDVFDISRASSGFGKENRAGKSSVAKGQNLSWSDDEDFVIKTPVKKL